MSLDQDLKDEERKGFIKQIADKLYQGIQKAYDTPEEQKRRWIWELVQNAKDIPNATGPVVICVTLQEEQLTFEHNGDPFKIGSLTGLLQQVSNKPSDSKDVNITGKFGTGFITTHMLSKLITVNGVLAYGDKFKRFELLLDREADSADALAVKVEELLKQKDGLSDEQKFPSFDKDNYSRAAEIFDTQFCYPLQLLAKPFASQGVSDLVSTGIYTLLINKNIGEYRINDSIDNRHLLIKRTLSPVKVIGVDTFQCDILDMEGTLLKRETLAYYQPNDDVLIAVPVNVNQSDAQITGIEFLEKDKPNLFKEFPLVGTERWLFNMICHVKEFEPTEPRDGLRLHVGNGVVDKQAEQNRLLLEKLLLNVLKFIQKLSSMQPPLSGLHYLALSPLPVKIDHDDIKAFLDDLQTRYRNELKKLNLIETVEGLKLLSDCRIPIYLSRGVDNYKKSFNFYSLCIAPFLQVVPLPEHYPVWFEIISKETDTWGKDLPLLLTDLLAFVSNLTAEDDFFKKDGLISWLNSLYSFLDDNREVDAYKEHKLLLNQTNELILLEEANLDEQAEIPELLKDVSFAFGKKYRSNLVHDSIRCPELKNILTIEKISNEINPEIGKIQQIDHFDALRIEAVLKLCHVSADSGGVDELRRLNIVKHLAKITEVWGAQSPVYPPMKNFNFDPALKVAVRFLLYQISLTGSVTGLNEKYLHFESNEEVLIWLNKLFMLLAGDKDLLHIFESAGIIPNQSLDFCLKKDLLLDVDKVDDFVKNIHKELLPVKDLKGHLLHIDITTIEFTAHYTLREIAGEIEDVLREFSFKEPDIRLRDAALNMISWLSGKGLDKQMYFNWLVGNKAGIVLTSLEKDQEHIFKILQANKDFKKLASLVESEQYDTLLELAQGEYDINDLKIIYDLAIKAGGIEKLRAYALEHLEEQQDFEFRKDLGTHVEELFKVVFGYLGAAFSVERVPHGQDFILHFPNDFDYHVEIKSFAMGKKRVHMSRLQGETAASIPENYALCILERPVDLTLVNPAYFTDNSLFLTFVGDKLKSKVEAAKLINELISQSNIEEDEGIDFDSTEYKFRIGKRLWDDPRSKKYALFLKYLEAVSKGDIWLEENNLK